MRAKNKWATLLLRKQPHTCGQYGGQFCSNQNYWLQCEQYELGWTVFLSSLRGSFIVMWHTFWLSVSNPKSFVIVFRYEQRDFDRFATSIYSGENENYSMVNSSSDFFAFYFPFLSSLKFWRSERKKSMQRTKN